MLFFGCREDFSQEWCKVRQNIKRKMWNKTWKKLQYIKYSNLFLCLQTIYLNIIYKGNFLFQSYSLKISFFNNRQSPYLKHWVSYLQSRLQNALREPWFESCWVCWNNLWKLYEITYSIKDIKQFISTKKTINE